MSQEELHRLPLSQLAKRHLFEPDTSITHNPVIRRREITQGNPEYCPRGWKSGHLFMAQCYYPLSPRPLSGEASTLGTRMIALGLGWEHHEIEHVASPNGYVDWGAEVLRRYSFHLKGNEKGADYVYGAIYCSLGEYSIFPPLLRSLLQKWDPDTNTFLFACGERTITLLDMNRLAGLPLDGEPYEEFVPPSHEVEPSLLMYPNFLCRLFDVWNQLSEAGHVGFQEWCDFFHNRLDDTFFIKNLEDGRLYTAAFIAIWLCRFVIPGGGPYIRPGVLVMAAWITLGRRISLAPAALCSLYYSLRLISTHPIGPSFIKRPWPVHYLVGWMGTYLKKTFGNKYRAHPLPCYRHSASKPEMMKIMSRTPVPFDSMVAHKFLQHHKNIKWHPYTMDTLKEDEYLQRIFQISVRRGMLPWRRDNLCIAEPYHPDRVARQFRLDQLIPYPPLASLYTRDEIGVAHAFWTHLLRIDERGLNYFPDNSRVGDSSVLWANWLKKFMNPVTCILGEVQHGILTGKVSYDQRTESRYALRRHIQSRKLSDKDFHVIKRVAVGRREQYILAIEIEEARVRDQWQTILHNYLNDAAANASPVQANEVSQISFVFYFTHFSFVYSYLLLFYFILCSKPLYYRMMLEPVVLLLIRWP
ncbi:hypothetical protein ZWY2020_033919 [Hordeum vulgare]|nr:hypothetical protein ZWY2020_033919 [Hordeum vulgare]